MKSAELLASFVTYCEAHPEHRFWQALRNWSEVPFIFAGEASPLVATPEAVVAKLSDTFYWEERTLSWRKQMTRESGPLDAYADVRDSGMQLLYPEPGSVWESVQYPEGEYSSKTTGKLPWPWLVGVRLIHCDPLVLHAPGACCYCDEFGADLQQQRILAGIEFTGEAQNYYSRFYLRDPSEVNRPDGLSQQWGGNRPAGTREEHDKAWRDYTAKVEELIGDDA